MHEYLQIKKRRFIIITRTYVLLVSARLLSNSIVGNESD